MSPMIAEPSAVRFQVVETAIEYGAEKGAVRASCLPLCRRPCPESGFRSELGTHPPF